MIPKSKTELPDTLKQQLVQTLEKEDTIEDVIVEPKKRDRQGQINFSVPEDVKEKWKILCVKSHINLKQGITFAMEHLIQEIEDGEMMLTVGGVMKKR